MTRKRIHQPLGSRNLLDGTAAENLTQQADTETERVGDAARWPVAWLMLRPAQDFPGQGTPAEALVLPLRVELALPDFLTGSKAYEASMRRTWAPGHRFQMFFAGKKKNARARAGALLSPQSSLSLTGYFG